jgi:hypothetical protein
MRELPFDGEAIAEVSSIIETTEMPPFSSDSSISGTTIQDLRKRKLQEESHVSIDLSDLDEEALVTELQRYLSED